jgi:hypothetical protein
MPVWNRGKKEEYFSKVEHFLTDYTKCFVVAVSGADIVFRRY